MRNGGQQFHVYQDPVDCPADLISRFFPAAGFITGASTGLIGVSHSFRDKILARSDRERRGSRYTSLYYQFSREAVRAVLSNPMLVTRSREIVTRYKPVLQSIVAGEHVSLTRNDLQDIDEFLADFSRTASPESRSALDRLRHDFEDPAVHSEFNISIVNGPRQQAQAQPRMLVCAKSNRVLPNATAVIKTRFLDNLFAAPIVF